ncbi:MAG: hypothetical protein KAH05_07990, partial [Clostridiales bacterium]|nr:hypothetical protein [Clostridiales bacterium]
VSNGFVEENMKDSKLNDKFQFFRHGYFIVDSKCFNEGNLVFNRSVSLKSSFRLNK